MRKRRGFDEQMKCEVTIFQIILQHLAHNPLFVVCLASTVFQSVKFAKVLWGYDEFPS